MRLLCVVQLSRLLFNTHYGMDYIEKPFDIQYLGRCQFQYWRRKVGAAKQRLNLNVVHKYFAVSAVFLLSGRVFCNIRRVRQTKNFLYLSGSRNFKSLNGF